MMLLRLAWRNIWRNKRRTYITAASILFAVLFASFMESLQRGVWDQMISNVVNYYFGYIQVHEKGYWDEQTINKAFDYQETLGKIPKEVSQIKAIIPRIESFALASTGNNTSGALVVGVEPDLENEMTSLESRLTEGEYLKPKENAALLAQGLAENLDLAVGDTIVLISQGYHGVNAAGKYPIKGLVKFGSPDLNKQLVYLPLSTAQYFYGAKGLVTSLAFKLDDKGDIPPVMSVLESNLDTSAYEIMNWEELIPDLVEARELDSAGNIIVYVILYLIIAFGIFGTILMMIKERGYEFGVLVAIGMKRTQLALILWIEVIALGLLGALSGILATIPLVLYFKYNPIRFSGEYAGMLEKFGFEPIMPTTFQWEIFILQAMIIFVITAITAIYPILKIRKMKPVEAMRG
jgi:putative ABC transport system permease protein